MRYRVIAVGVVAVALIVASPPAQLVATTAQNVWISVGPAGEYVRALAIDPQQPTTLFAGTWKDGVYKSTDGGRRWQAMNSGLNSPYITALAIDPRTPTTIYAGVGAVSMYTGGVFKSVDEGESWHAINNGLGFTSHTVYALAIDPQTPATLYAGTWGGVFKSTDAGGSWRDMSTGLDATVRNPGWGPNILSLAIDPRAPTTLYAVAGIYERTGVFKSTDGGGSWRALGTGLADLSVVDLAIEPQTPTTLYAGTKKSGVLKSTDGGESWRAINNGLADLRVNALAIDPRSPTTMYAGTWHGVFESTDGGGTWRTINDGLTDLSAVVLVITPNTPTTLYAGTWGSGVFVSGSVSGMRAPSNLRTAGSLVETGSVTYLSAGADGRMWLAIEIRGDLPDYAGSRKTILYRTSSPKDRLERVVEVSGHGPIRRLWFFGAGRVLAWLGGGFGRPAPSLIMRTVNGGVRWSSSSPSSGLQMAMPGADPLFSFISLTEGWMLVSTGVAMHSHGSALYHTLDGGDHWTEITRVGPGLPRTNGLGTEAKTGIEFRDAAHGWMGTDLEGMVPNLPSLYMSHDGGATWAPEELPPPPPPTGAPAPWTGQVMPPRFFGARAGVAIALLGRTPFVYQTSDGGRTWNDPRPFPVSADYFPPDFPQLDIFSPTVWGAASNHSVWLTSDAGRTWSEHSVPLPPTYKVDRIALAGPTQVWVVGSEGSPGDRKPIADYIILKTEDAGLHWTRVALPQGH